MLAAAGEVEKLHLEFCLRARTAVLAGYDRSILGGESGEGKKAKRSEALRERWLDWPDLSSSWCCYCTSRRGRRLEYGRGGYGVVVDPSDSEFRASKCSLASENRSTRCGEARLAPMKQSTLKRSREPIKGRECAEVSKR